MCILPEIFDSIIFLEVSDHLNLELWPYVEFINKQFVNSFKQMDGI